MTSNDLYLESLGRQAADIAYIEARIEERQSRGEPVGLSLSMLEQDRKVFRRKLGQAPLDVLEAFEARSRFT